MFDIKTVLAECRAYIDTISDYKIELPGKIVVTEDVITEYGSSVSVKSLLIEFLFECEEETVKGKLHLIRFLRKKHDYWSATQGHKIGRLNEIINRTYGEDKARFENQKERFFNFFHYNYTLIDLISARLTDTSLNNLTQFRLKEAGLDWIIKGSKSLAQLAQLNEQATASPSVETTQAPILFIVPSSRTVLYDDLKEYIDCDENGNATELYDLIFSQKVPSKPIVVTCKVETFGATFYESGAVPEGGAPLLSQQLSKLFARNTGKKIIPFEPGFLVKKLRSSGQDVKPNKKTKL